ncbi:hypothetical protein O181_012429, partial [Austropuccinia psidii MF-1]|nr:hypothetical protein [Austropuccinia psidii MF-1]
LILESCPFNIHLLQDRAQDVLTPTPRAPLDGTTAVPQLRAPCGQKTTFKGPGEDGEEEESDGTEGAPAPVVESNVLEGQL